MTSPSLKRLLVLVSALACAGAVVAAGGYHLWYDENGQAVYSQFAPDGGRPSEIVKGPPPPAESPEVAQQRLQEQLQRSADFREDQELAAQKTAEAAAVADADAERCEAARRNLELLNGRPRQLYQMPDGTVKRMSEEERAEQRARMQQVIDESCP